VGEFLAQTRRLVAPGQEDAGVDDFLADVLAGRRPAPAPQSTARARLSVWCAGSGRTAAARTSTAGTRTPPRPPGTGRSRRGWPRAGSAAGTRWWWRAAATGRAGSARTPAAPPGP